MIGIDAIEPISLAQMSNKAIPPEIRVQYLSVLLDGYGFTGDDLVAMSMFDSFFDNVCKEEALPAIVSNPDKKVFGQLVPTNPLSDSAPNGRQKMVGVEKVYVDYLFRWNVKRKLLLSQQKRIYRQFNANWKTSKITNKLRCQIIDDDYEGFRQSTMSGFMTILQKVHKADSAKFFLRDLCQDVIDAKSGREGDYFQVILESIARDSGTAKERDLDLKISNLSYPFGEKSKPTRHASRGVYARDPLVEFPLFKDMH